MPVAQTQVSSKYCAACEAPSYKTTDTQEENEYLAKGLIDCWVGFDVAPGVVRMAWYDVTPMALPPSSESTSACTVTPA